METGRFSDSSDDMGTVREEPTICRECGKGFQSWKALYGHMRCHPKKERVFDSLDDDSRINGKNQTQVMDRQSNDAGAVLHPCRSTITRYCNNATTSSSSVLEIDQEQIDAALCLMKLSRDVGHWDGLNSFDAESSHTNSEDQTRSNPKSLKIKKLDSFASDSGFWRVGLKKVQSDASVDGFVMDDEQTKRKLEDRAGNVELGKDFSINKKRSKLDYIEAELEQEQDSIEEAETDRADSEFGRNNYNSRKKRSVDVSDSEKRSRFVCRTCSKPFKSHQALGGHMSSHKKFKDSSTSRIERVEKSIETDPTADPTADNQLTSLVGDLEFGDNQTIVIQEQLPEIHHLLDLNLTPTEEQTDSQYNL